MGVFNATVKYGDFKGSAAADELHKKEFFEHLKKNKLVTETEHLVGLRVNFGENHGEEIEKTNVVAYVRDSNSPAGIIKEVRAIHVDIPIAKLFSHFKRFDLVMTFRGIDLDDAIVNDPRFT